MSRKITVELTVPQVDALVSAVCTEELHLEDRQNDGDSEAGGRLATLKRACDALLRARREQTRR